MGGGAAYPLTMVSQPPQIIRRIMAGLSAITSASRGAAITWSLCRRSRSVVQAHHTISRGSRIAALGKEVILPTRTSWARFCAWDSTPCSSQTIRSSSSDFNEAASHAGRPGMT